MLPTILHECPKYLVILKEAQVAMQASPVTPGGARWKQTLQALQKHVGLDAPPLKVIHRLDAGTSGCLVLGKTVHAAAALSQQFEKGEVLKTYIAMVDHGNAGWKHGPEGKVECMLRTTDTGVEIDRHKRPYSESKLATMAWRHLEQRGRFSTLEIAPKTGRKHQIRIQLAKMLNAPVIGDFKYGYSGRPVEGHLLHCAELSFYRWQKTGKRETVTVSAALPKSFRNFPS